MTAIRNKSTVLVLDLLDVHDETSHQRALEIMGQLMDLSGESSDDHLLDVLIDRLADAIAHYENVRYPIRKSPPHEILKALMENHDLKQSDLSDIFSSQGNLSQILKGNRKLTATHIAKLAKRFKVSPELFFSE